MIFYIGYLYVAGFLCGFCFSFFILRAVMPRKLSVVLAGRMGTYLRVKVKKYRL